MLDEPLRIALSALLESYGLAVRYVTEGEQIPGSYWGDSEAGLVNSTLFLRPDTPLHSALHEAAHFVCMDEARRRSLDRDAGGDVLEENAVCYLQILWGDVLPEVGAESVMADMDEWGYTFRLGSAARWFREDAEDARGWLQSRGLLDQNDALRLGQRVA
jgi:hypothetical protein